MNQRELEKLKKIDQQVQTIKKAATSLKKLSGGMQALDCNANRILASARMLEINFSDVLGIIRN